MYKQKQHITPLTIQYGLAHHSFQIPIPLDCKKITGIKVSAKTIHQGEQGFINHRMRGFISLRLPHQMQEFYANDVTEYNNYQPLSIPNTWNFDPYENMILGGVASRNYHIKDIDTLITGIYRDYAIKDQDYFFEYIVTIYLTYKTN